MLGVKKAHLTPAVRAMCLTSWLSPLTRGILAVATPRSDSCSFRCSFRSSILLRLAPSRCLFHKALRIVGLVNGVADLV